MVSIVGGGLSRRGFLKGVLGAGAVLGLTATGLGFWFDTGEAFADVPTQPLGTGTSPEQVHIQIGENPAFTAAGYQADPATAMTVSWLSPGQTPQPAPSLSYSATGPITALNPGSQVTPVQVASTDDMNAQTAYIYHAAVTGLTPGTTYYYLISDGASPPSAVSGSFTTAPGDTSRTSWRFTSFGDLATPYTGNPSGQSWNESSNNARAAVQAIAALSPQPVVHLLNGDICYANLNYNNHPSVWRDFFTNLQTSALTVPWMPCLGNHEIEWGTHGGSSPENNSGQVFNGTNGYQTYLSRFSLPDNGVSGFEGNFYCFQIGTVLFISLDADDVIYQDGGSFYAPTSSSTTPTSGTGSTSNPYVFPPLSPNPNPNNISIPPGSSAYNNQYTGTLAIHNDANNQPASLMPSGSTPNAQTIWLASTLQAARAGGTASNHLFPSKLPIDMIVVQMHQCALSSSATGNGSDLGIRQAWLPLFEQYAVDLVVAGHDHNYERSYPVNGYNPSPVGVVGGPGSTANPNQTPGATVFTRQPKVATSSQSSINGDLAYDTSQGTVFLILGGGGENGPTDIYLTDASGNPAARVTTERNPVYQITGAASGNGNWVKGSADSVEPAPWSARRDGSNWNGTGSKPAIGNSWGYAVFDVDPGQAPGQTVITLNYYDAPAATGPGSTTYNGSTQYSQTPLETVLFSHGTVPGSVPVGLPEVPSVAAAGAAAALLAGGAYHLANRRNNDERTATVAEVG